MAHMDAIDARAEDLAAAATVTLKTARRWKRQGRIPTRHHAALALLILRDLGALSKQWQGFRLLDDAILTPEGTRFSYGDVRAIPLQEQLIAELKKRLAEPQQWKLL
jgi:hypothetical protein